MKLFRKIAYSIKISSIGTGRRRYEEIHREFDIDRPGKPDGFYLARSTLNTMKTARQLTITKITSSLNMI